MQQTMDQEPFEIIKDFRKMVNRRNRYHNKRKPKLYPRTNIKTRSMEHQKKNPDLHEIDQSECFMEIVQSSSVFMEEGTSEL